MSQNDPKRTSSTFWLKIGGGKTFSPFISEKHGWETYHLHGHQTDNVLVITLASVRSVLCLTDLAAHPPVAVCAMNWSDGILATTG
jgi:hypothetical protein